MNYELKITNYELLLFGYDPFSGFLDGGNDSAELIGIGINALEFCFGQVSGIFQESQPVAGFTGLFVGDTEL